MSSRDGGEWQPRPARRIGDPPPAPSRQSPQSRPSSQSIEQAPFEPELQSRPIQQPSGVGSRGGDAGARGVGGLLALLIVALVVAVVIVVFFEPGLVDTSVSGSETGGGDAQASGLSVTGPVVRLMQPAPPIPDVLGAASPIYEIAMPDQRLGPYDFTLRLTSPTTDPRNLGAFTWNGQDWVRLGEVTLSSDGVSARVTLNDAPENLAIMRRLRFRDVIAGRVPRGDEPQSALAGSLTIVHPDGWQPGEDASLLGSVDLPSSVVSPTVWPTVSADPADADLVNDILASDNMRRQHIANIQHAIQSGQHDGVDIHYLDVSPALRPQFTSFISELAERLHRDDRGLSVHVPITASGGVGEGAYDLSQLGALADFIVIEPPLDPTLFQAAIDASLPTLLERVDRDKLLLALPSNAVVHSAGGYREISQREALRIASTLSIREPGPYRPGVRVTLQGNSIMLDNLSGGLRWDNVNRVVSFTYPDQAGTPVTIWIHNRFSAAFRLLVVSQSELGGVYVSNASADPGNANLWPAIAAFFESGAPDLRLPNAILFAPVFSVDAGELSGASGNGWQFWDVPNVPGDYQAQLVISDGDVRVGNVITAPIRAEGQE